VRYVLYGIISLVTTTDILPANATCNDNIKNGIETDVDCGGSDCEPCAENKQCNTNEDCASLYCLNSLCSKHAKNTYPDLDLTLLLAGPACDDNAQNGAETDVDCGGETCSPCAIDLKCLVHTDCSTNNCTQSICGKS
jgi:hypothetical protein